METIRVFSWQPSDAINFGDEIGPMIVDTLCKWFGIGIAVQPTTAPTPAKILAVGSILHEARGADVIWGAGVNSKNRLALPTDGGLTFCAVRGPLTRSVVLDQGYDCPPVYGDPGLLFPMLFDHEVRRRRGEIEAAAAGLGVAMPHTIVIPNINDDRFLPEFAAPSSDEGLMYVRPNLDPITVAAYISSAERVISSSLHGLVFADAYGRRATRLLSQYEPEFKYTDYYLGTGRATPPGYADVDSALAGEDTPPLDWDPQPLLDAFPLSGRSGGSFKQLVVKTFPVKVGQVYKVGDLEPENIPFDDGWAPPVNGSIWTIDTWATMRFRLVGEFGPNPVLRLRIGTLKTGKGNYERLRVVQDGAMISSERIERGKGSRQIDVEIPKVGQGSEVILRMKLENPSAPAQFGGSKDSRLLGIWISQFEVLPGKPK